MNRRIVIFTFLLSLIICGLSITAFAAWDVEDDSDKVTDAYLSPGKTLVQKVKVTGDDIESFTKIKIENVSGGPEIKKEDLKKIIVEYKGNTLLNINIDDLQTPSYEIGYDLDKTTKVKKGEKIIVRYRFADTIYFINGVSPPRYFRPKVIINANPSKDAIYGENLKKKFQEIELYPPFEEESVLTPPAGGKFLGSKLWALRIRLTDDDKNDNPVTINPFILYNRSPKNPIPEDAIEKVEIKRVTEDQNELPLGETTDPSGLNSATGGQGVQIPTLQNNQVKDDKEISLNVYITFAEDFIFSYPVQSYSLQIGADILSHENNGEGVRGFQGPNWVIHSIPHRPPIDFTYNPSKDLKYNTKITFTPKNISFPKYVTDYRWEFSDGTTKSGYSVTHTFSEGGKVWAKLIVEYDISSSGTTGKITGEKTKSFNIKEPGAPTADFSYDPADPKVGQKITFTDQSTAIGDASIVERTWDFGDGKSVTYKDVNKTTATHSYSSAKVYQVKLTVKDSRGKSASVTHEVAVSPMGVTAAFSVSPSSPVTNEPVTFGDQSSTVAGEKIVKWEWDFGDGNTETIDSGDSGTTTHTYTSSGVYTVTLKATDSRGKTGTVSHDVPVSARGITADFSYDPSSPRINQKVSFTDQSSIPEGSSITKWIWEFGDGKVRTIIADGAQNGNTSHTYPKTGTYQVILTIITSQDLAASAIKEVTITANPPEADFSYSPSLPQVNESVQFTDNSTEGDGNIVGWEWDFGDGSTSTEQNPTHAYSESGNYQVTLTVTDEYDNTDSVSKTITVAEKGEDIPTYPYPNPAGSPVTIVYYLPANTTEADLWMIDFSGQLAVHKANLDTNQGENQVTVDLSDHPNGLYFYWIKGVADGKRIKSKTLKLLVQHGG